MKLEIKGRDGQQIGRCPFCQDVFHDGEEEDACSRCGAHFHLECAAELKFRCAIFGCIGRIPAPEGAEVSAEKAWKASRRTALLSRAELFADREARSQREAPRGPRREVVHASPTPSTVASRSMTTAIVTAVLTACSLVPDYAVYAASFLSLYAGWNGVQNFLQTIALASDSVVTVDGQINESHVGKVVALQGMPRPLRPLALQDETGLIWFHYERRVYRRVNKEHGRNEWALSVQREHCVPFELAGAVVSNEPSEVYGVTESQQLITSLGHILRGAEVESRRQIAGLDDEWTVSKFLSGNQPLTAVGRLVKDGDRYLLEPDTIAGLLYTTTRERSIVTEGAKTILFAVLVAFAISILVAHFG